MAITKPQLKTLIQSQLPEFVREEYETFVQFLEAYYEFVESTQVNLNTARDLDKTLESFVTYFKDELAAKLPYSTINERFLLSHIKDHYRAKGSENSFKLLFRILFNKEVTLDYPSKQMLRASDGKWNQDVSVFVKILQGSPNDIIGKLVDVVTSTKIIRVLVDRRQYVEVEVDRAVRVSDTVYEFFIDRRFFGNISVGDRLRYRDDANGIFFNGQILTTTQNVIIQQPGTGFKVGDLYNIKNFDGYGSILKVSSVTPTGGIASGVFIKYGIGYTTDFTTTISATSGQDVAGTAGTVISRVDTIVGINTVTNLTITEGMDGFAETGTFSIADYNNAVSTDPSYASGPAIDGTYAGLVIREFGISSVDSQVSLTEPAILKVTLGPLAKYPGYYVNNDGFLNDAIYIQDSRYYQAYSYVIKIDEALDAYKTAVKNLVHPAGMAIFGEYDIRNEFDIGITLESMLKILNVTVNDSIAPKDETGTLFTRTVPYLDYTKPIEETTLNYDNFADGQSVTITEVGYTDSLTRTLPYLDISKPIDSTTLNYGLVAESQDVTPSELTSTYADSSTRLGAEIFNFSKSLSAGHFINDGTTTDDESVTMTEVGYTADLSRTLPILDVSKLLYNNTFNYDNVLDNNTTIISEDDYGAGTLGTRLGVSIISSNKVLSPGHYLVDGTSTDVENVTMVDTDATSASDLNRTVPSISVTTTLNSQYYIVGTATYAGDNSVSLPTSGETGVLDLNPYAAGDYFLHDDGLYVGVPYVSGQGFGYQTFTGAGV